MLWVGPSSLSVVPLRLVHCPTQASPEAQESSAALLLLGLRMPVTHLSLAFPEHPTALFTQGSCSHYLAPPGSVSLQSPSPSSFDRLFSTYWKKRFRERTQGTYSEWDRAWSWLILLVTERFRGDSDTEGLHLRPV